jgi:hypothetical protein
VLVHIQNKPYSLKVFIMPQTEVSAPHLPPVAAPRLMQATVRFVVSVAALISISLLLASL